MSKKSTQTQKQSQKSQNALYLLIVAVIAVIAGLLLISSTTNTEPGVIQKIAPAEYQQQFSAANANHVLLDVRTPEEFNSGHIPGAVNISVETLAARLSELPADKTIVVYCRSGNRSATAAQILAEAGYSSIYDLGGINTWAAQGLPIE